MSDNENKEVKEASLMLRNFEDILSSEKEFINFDFDVTTENFTLKSIKFKFNEWIYGFGMINVQIIVDDISYFQKKFEVNISELPIWIGYEFPDGLPLSIGVHRITVFAPEYSYWRLYVAKKPSTVSGMTIISDDVYVMEMSYSFVGTLEKDSLSYWQWKINSSIFEGYPYVYVKEFDSSLEMPGKKDNLWKINSSIFEGYPYIYIKEFDGSLEIPGETLLLPDIDIIYLNKNGRYVGNEIDILINIGDLKNIENGDMLYYRLKQDNDLIYEYSKILNNNINNDSHIIQSNIFANLNIGDYIVSATIVRNDFEKTIQTSYRIIKNPSIINLLINPTSIAYVDLNATTMIVEFSIDDNNIDSIIGILKIKDTLYERNFNNNIIEMDDLNELNVGKHSIIIDMNISHSEYGISHLHYEMPDAFIVVGYKGIMLNYKGKYLSGKDDLIVQVYENIQINDIIQIQIIGKSFDSDTEIVIYEENINIVESIDFYEHIILNSVLQKLSIGIYYIRTDILKSEQVE